VAITIQIEKNIFKKSREINIMVKKNSKILIGAILIGSITLSNSKRQGEQKKKMIGQSC
jgi:hypothetical protein